MDFKNKDEIFYNAIILLKSGKIDLSIKVLKKIYKYYPRDYKTLYYIARTYLDIKDYKNSQKYYSKLLIVNPSNVQAAFDLSYIYLLNRKMIKGFNLYESRIKFKEFNQLLPNNYPHKIKELKNKKVFIYCEQGLGDTIHFMRFIKHITKYTKYIDICIQDSLYSLMKYNYKDLNFVDSSYYIKVKYDYVFSLLSIPYLKKLESFEPLKKYLTVDKKVKKTKNIDNKYINIGLCWQGEVKNKRDKYRSFDIDMFLDQLNKFDMGRYKFYSLQKDVRINNIKVIDLGVNFSDFYDTAVAIKSMDLIITVDTSVCHLYGAMGKKTYLLLPYYPDWRWGDTLEKSDLYKSVKYFRQIKKDSWIEPFTQIVSKLKEFKSK